ncbi:5-deoxy-glucuronate isomerase [Paracoccaceae bacterium]|nr:5-deoxy-glucuronate isomerase [Paracoccaceae bacterium]MDC0582258.1 5-deoxy-glucuronate isomerase [Paracoccaceae bacterium]
MSKLHIKPKGRLGKVFDVTPKTAGWSYVGFGLYHLKAGDKVAEQTAGNEAILVVVEGKVSLKAGGQDFGEMGDRMSVFERTPPHALYVPQNEEWSAVASTDCVLAICTAPGTGTYPAARLGPEGIDTMPRGAGANTRYVNNIAMEGRDVASSLLVTEVFTPQGNWSSYPSHRHDVDNFPEITYLEETYYHRLNPSQGFGVQRVYTEDGSLDETMAVKDGDVVLVPKGHHPCGAPYGYEMYYLNVMAGPLRKWRFQNDPDHNWIYQRDSAK